MKPKTIWLFLFCLWLVGCTDSIPEPTATLTPRPTFTATALPATAISQVTATTTPPPTATLTPVPTFTPTKTPIPTRKPTATPTPTITPSPTPAPTATPLPPVLIPVNVSLPGNGQVIQPGNVGQLQEVARLGLGKAIQVEYAPDGSRVAVATPLGVYFYDTATYQQVGFIAAANELVRVAFSPDWQTMAMGTLRSGYVYVELRQLPEGQLLHLLPRESQGVGAIWFVANGSQLAIGEERWQVSDGTRLPDVSDPTRPQLDADEDFEAMATSPDGQTVVVLTNQRIFQVRLSDNTVVQEVFHDEAYCEFTPMEHFLFSPNGTFLAAGGWDDCLWVWRASDLQPLYGLDDRAVLSQRGVGTMAAPPQFQGPGWLRITDLAFSPDGQTLAAASGYGIIRLWNLQDGTLQGRLPTMHHPKIAYSPDGHTLTAWNGLVQFWQPDTQSLLFTLENHFEASNMVLSPDGQQLFFLNNLYVQQWFIFQNQMRRLYGLTDFGMSLALAPGGQTFATGLGNSEVWLWQTDIGQPTRLLGDHESPWGAATVLFSPDGQSVISLSHDDGIRQWHIDGASSSEYYGDWNTVLVAVSPTEPIIAYDAPQSDFEGIELIRLGETEPFLGMADPGEGYAGALLFSPDGRFLAGGDHEGSGDVWLWDVSTGQLQMTLTGSPEPFFRVTNMAFSPDGQLLAVLYSNGRLLRLWRLSDGMLLRTLEMPYGAITALQFSPDGQKLFSCGDDGVIRVWGING